MTGEVRRPEQAKALAAAIAAGAIGEAALDSAEEQVLLAPIAKAIGPSDAECLAAASCCGGVVASDETRKKFVREAGRLVGDERLVGLHSLLVEVIASRLVTMDRLRGAVAALATTAATSHDRDDVEHLERVLAQCAGRATPRESG